MMAAWVTTIPPRSRSVDASTPRTSSPFWMSTHASPTPARRARCCAGRGGPAGTQERHQAPPRPRSTTPRPVPPNKLTDEEMGQILDVLRSERFVDLSPAQVFHILLDEGRYLASVSTYYRLLRATGE